MSVWNIDHDLQHKNLSDVLILAFIICLCRKVHFEIDLFPITLDVDIA